MTDLIERLVACWNALEGIEDPEAFMRDVRDFMDVETYEPIMRQIKVVRGHLKGGDE